MKFFSELLILICVGFSFQLQAKNCASLYKPFEIKSFANANPTDELRHLKDAEILERFENFSEAEQLQALTIFLERKSELITVLFELVLKLDKPLPQTLGEVANSESLAGEFYQLLHREKHKAERKAYYEKTNSTRIQEELKHLFGSNYETSWSVIQCEELLKKWKELAFQSESVHEKTLCQILQTSGFQSIPYLQLKFWAQKYDSPEILAGLATFKKVEDIAFLKSKKHKAYLAIAQFPHPSFFGNLNASVNSDYSKTDYQLAVCSFKNANAVQLTQQIANLLYKSKAPKTERDDRLFAFYDLIEKQNNAVFKPTLRQIEKLMSRP